MAEISKLSVNKRKVLVQRLNRVMADEFSIDQKSINGFWETFAIGARIVKEQSVKCQAEYQEKKLKWQREIA